MNKNLNILFLANNVLSPHSGGIERTTFNLIKELVRDPRLHIFAVFLKIPEKIEQVTFAEDIITTGKQIADYINLYKIDIVVFPGGAWYTNLLKTFDPTINCKIITCLHSPPKVGEDYIIQNLKLEFIKKDNYSKVISLPHYLLTYVKHPIRVYNARKQYRIGYNNSDAYVLLSESFFEDFKKYAKLLNIEKLMAIGNALSFDETLKLDDITKKSNNVLIVSRFDEVHKRLSLAIKAWQMLKVKDWHLRIVGFGKDENLYRQTVQRNHIKNIVFEGKRNPFSYYKECKIFLMTSSSLEGWGMTLTEALQMGCVPIVMDSFSSLHDIIEHNYNGLIVKNNDVQELSNAIQMLMVDEVLWLRLSKNAIESSSKFTIEKTVVKWKQLFGKVLATNKS